MADDGLLHIYECPWVLRLPGGNPDFRRCGHIANGPGNCPYDHAEDVPMVPLTALVLCSDCGEPIMRDDGRASDGRLICSQCAFSEIAASGRDRT
jgi:hypothetical protein